MAEIVGHTASRALGLLGIEVPGMPQLGRERPNVTHLRSQRDFTAELEKIADLQRIGTEVD
jgi:hypothetical protein